MAIKINFKGFEFSVASTAEAAALVRDLTDTATLKTERPSIRGRKPRPPPDIHETIANGRQIAIAFLTTIANADADGATADDIAKSVGVKHTKGVGGKAARVNNILIELGLKPDEIYSNTKTLEGRFWKPLHGIHEAIEKLKN